jgi:hypothetical protein
LKDEDRIFQAEDTICTQRCENAEDVWGKVHLPAWLGSRRRRPEGRMERGHGELNMGILHGTRSECIFKCKQVLFDVPSVPVHHALAFHVTHCDETLLRLLSLWKNSGVCLFLAFLSNLAYPCHSVRTQPHQMALIPLVMKGGLAD